MPTMNLANCREWYECAEPNATDDFVGSHAGLTLTQFNSPYVTTIGTLAARGFDRPSARYGERADHAALSFGAGKSFTFAMRLRFRNSDAGAAANHGIAEKSDGGTSEYQIFCAASAGLTLATFYFSVSGVGFVSVPDTDFFFDTDYTEICEFDQPNGIVRITQNDNQGSPYETTGLSGSCTDGTGAFRLGHLDDSLTEKFNGKIAAFAIFEGLMSSADKTTFHNGGAGVSYAEVAARRFFLARF